MERAKNGEIELFFLDAAHFVMGIDFCGYIYGRARRFCKTFSGRHRYNVLGALNFLSKRVITVTNDSYITAPSVCDIFKKLADQYPGREIHIILDNARYQKCAAVKDHAKELGLHCVYIPPYSPNLNLIERLWKFVKGDLRARYYADFQEFSAEIDALIDSTTGKNSHRINTLIGEDVQLFDDLEQAGPNSFTRKSAAA